MPLCPAVLSALSSSCCLFDVFSDKLNDDDGDDDDDDDDDNDDDVYDCVVLQVRAAAEAI